jgi:hypothetical protein
VEILKSNCVCSPHNSKTEESNWLPLAYHGFIAPTGKCTAFFVGFWGYREERRG